jgi:hypothetical protein
MYCAMWNENGDCVDWEFDPGTTTCDSGTVTITVNGHPNSVGYGSASTASSIASDQSERFGIQFVASPKHADMLLATGRKLEYGQSSVEYI